MSSLFDASLSGDITRVNSLLAAGVDPNSSNANRTSALTAAACNGHLAVVRALIARGALVTTSDNQGFSPLYLSCYKGHEAIVRELVNASPPPNVSQPTADGTTPLHAASLCGYAEIVRMLLDKGAEVNARNHGFHTPLGHALGAAIDTSEVQMLLEAAGGET